MASPNARERTRVIAVTGMLLAVMLLFTFTQIGFIQIGPLAATLMHIPVLIGLMVEGLPVGMGLGFAFGIISLMRAYLAPTATSFVLQNPIISVLPRLLFPLVAWAVSQAIMKATKKRGAAGEALATGVGAFCGAATNTALVLGLIYVMYGERYGMAMKTPVEFNAVGAVLLGTALTNGLPEAIVAGIIVPAVTTALNRAGLRRRDIQQPNK